MAPGVRSKKRGNLRIDAALDAMNPFGFPPKLVRDAVKELLSVYGGDDGWVFIEEGSYTLLVDTLLEKVKDGVTEKDGRAEDHQKTSVAACSLGTIDKGPPSNPGAEITVEQNDGVSISPNMGDEALRITSTLPANDLEERKWKEDRVSGDGEHFRSTFERSSPAPIPKISRRKPYHGWISSNDKEDLIYLTPAPLPDEIAKLLVVSNAQKKRKKHRDVKPEES